MSAGAGQRNFVEVLGARLIGSISYIGGMAILLTQAIGASKATLARSSGRQAIVGQMVRVGVRSVGIVCLVQTFIGVILALQMAPPLEPLGQVHQIATIIGIAGFRMLGPILTGVIISGFAGASIAAEIGTMVVAEEIEALRAHALNPVRFLVVPRLLATLVMMVLLTIIANWMIAIGGYVTALLVLKPEVSAGYWALMQENLLLRDFYSGLIMAGVFGVLISLIACYEGLKVRGGAEGVGRATTMTVVYSIVSIVLAAGVFTTIFYVFEF